MATEGMSRAESMAVCVQASEEHRALARRIGESLNEPGQCLLYVEAALQKLTVLRMNLEALRETP